MKKPFISKTVNSNGTIRIKIGRRSTLIQTNAEAEAFIAGYKIAQVEIGHRIADLLKVKDKVHEL